MCGILFAMNSSTKKGEKAPFVNGDIMDMLQDQLGRGKEGFGIAFVNGNYEVEVRRATELTKATVDLYMKKSRIIMMHHRNPTSSENKISQTHPMFVSNIKLKYDYYVIHNGVIGNCKELKEEHEKLGFRYTTEHKGMKYGKEETIFNDSESLAIELALYEENLIPEMRFQGSMAIIALKIDKEKHKAKELLFARTTSPMVMVMTRGKIRLSSEGPGNEVKADRLYKVDLRTKKISKKKLKQKKVVYKEVTSHPYSYQRGYGDDYDDYPQRSIWQNNREKKDTTTNGTTLKEDELKEKCKKLSTEEDEKKETSELKLAFPPKTDSLIGFKPNTEVINTEIADLAFTEINDDFMTNIADAFNEFLFEIEDPQRVFFIDEVLIEEHIKDITKAIRHEMTTARDAAIRVHMANQEELFLKDR